MLARKMPKAELGRLPSADKLLHQLNVHLEEVQETYDRVIHSQQPLYYMTPAHRPEPVANEPDLSSGTSNSNLIRFLDQRAPQLARELESIALRKVPRSFETFLERIYASPDLMQLVNATPTLIHDVVDLFENSMHFAEELIRRPELIEEIAHARSGVPSHYQDLLSQIHDPSELRRFFRREMLRIQVESVCMRAPIFNTLGRTSDLADSVICAAYALSRDQVCRLIRRSRMTIYPKIR